MAAALRVLLVGPKMSMSLGLSPAMVALMNPPPIMRLGTPSS
jgi:hypothetical protein